MTAAVFATAFTLGTTASTPAAGADPGPAATETGPDPTGPPATRDIPRPGRMATETAPSGQLTTDTVPSSERDTTSVRDADTTGRRDTTARLLGAVYVEETGRPLAGARVVLRRNGFLTVTDTAGLFLFQGLSPGPDTLGVYYMGFGSEPVPAWLEAGRITSLDVPMARSVVEVADLMVTVEGGDAGSQRRIIIPEFERRRKQGLGWFIGPDEVERRNAFDVSDLVRSIPGVYIRYDRFGDPAVTMRALGLNRARCRPRVFWNGNPSPWNDLDMFLPSEVLALEVYTRPAQLPARFQALDGCGAIVVWTR